MTLKLKTKIPQDKHLPQLKLALSPEEMLKLFQERVFEKDNKFEVENCQVNYLRYKPQTTCLVGYAVTLKDNRSNASFEHLFYAKLYKDSDFNLARQKLEKRPYFSSNGVPPVSFWPDFNLVLFSFPNDRLLKSLKWVIEPHKLKRIILPYFSQYDASWRVQDRNTRIEPVRYKPERRCVLRCKMKFKKDDTGEKTKEKFFVRVYTDNTGQVAHQLLERLNKAVTVTDKKINIPKVLG